MHNNLSIYFRLKVFFNWRENCNYQKCHDESDNDDNVKTEKNSSESGKLDKENKKNLLITNFEHF